MSKRERTELLQIQVSDQTTQERFQQARHLVADELGVSPDELSRWEVVRETLESYTGYEPLGRWRED